MGRVIKKWDGDWRVSFNSSSHFATGINKVVFFFGFFFVSFRRNTRVLSKRHINATHPKYTQYTPKTPTDAVSPKNLL